MNGPSHGLSAVPWTGRDEHSHSPFSTQELCPVIHSSRKSLYGIQGTSSLRWAGRLSESQMAPSRSSQQSSWNVVKLNKRPQEFPGARAGGFWSQQRCLRGRPWLQASMGHMASDQTGLGPTQLHHHLGDCPLNLATWKFTSGLVYNLE